MRFARFVFPFGAVVCLFGCSDPVTPTPRGAINVNFSVPPGGGCNVKVHQTKIGDVDQSHRNAVVTDGEGASVACSVTGSGTFAVDASARLGATSLDIVVNSISAGATVDNPAKGVVSYSSTETAGNAYTTPNGQSCNFYFVPKSGEGVDAGKVWLAFTCPTIAFDTYTCALGASYAIFEDCEGSASED